MNKLLEYALTELGNGEEGGNNMGPHIIRYYNGKTDEGQAWCMPFVSYCMLQVGYFDNDLFLEYHISARKAWNEYRKVFEVTDPQLGDLAFYSRPPQTWTGHVGIVSEVNPATYKNIEGNVGAYPSKVKFVQHKFSDPLFLGFIRLPEI